MKCDYIYSCVANNTNDAIDSWNEMCDMKKEQKK